MFVILNASVYNERKAGSKMRKIIVLSFVMLMFTVGCSNGEKIVTLSNGDIQETTKSVTQLPSFLDDKADMMRNVYQVAAQNEELLQYIPCYCGCAESANHESNLHCFISESSKKAVVWDDHSTRCGLCLETAAESILMKREGKTVEEIRNYIDEKYKYMPFVDLQQLQCHLFVFYIVLS